MGAVSYCRVSTEEQVQEGVSLAAQEALVRAYCAGAGGGMRGTVRYLLRNALYAQEEA